MRVQRRKRRGSVPAIGSPQRHKLRELRSRAILEQVTCNEAANMAGVYLGVEAESYMIDVPHVVSWEQPDNDPDLLFNSAEMDLFLYDVNIGAIDPLNQIYCPGPTPEMSSAWDNNLEGLDVSVTWDSSEYSETTSPSSQAESNGPSDAYLSHDIPISYLNELTANNMSVDELMAILEHNLVTETLTNDISYDQTTESITRDLTMNQNILNDTTMDYYTANYPQGMDWGSSNTEMSAELTPSNMDDDNFDDEAGNSSTVSFNDPSSDTSPTGELRPGYRWCCDEWKKHDGNFK
ncbi:uncharacterized protein Triagg1_1525 [Trichoderma aggressivum f. europaeum]|uniref:Uncharacterized protein n=1 Tax=Trichoderma aggressivum f. europaeum TaxID=173218 RepID=A0AAE1IM05_9HYPO|nr:hypothetical protein Triagg1_1525 [Trichoderma aggressivum f. europaeum]